ncbi:hypothetical protein E3P92_03203 [Wallemia ichthyophaga]|uniref:Putative tubulin--tyrosine ligase PBY1 n=1 Tax=Wallemia ichthyophaga (strain EXF-994 / CBS 113033) TaxID=1299270 RepID=R9AEM4_WALI9|nr:putative tubulin--tyrosine ligase PBY1 [Wallemia ichthyophaga EXF-994]EOR00585.1 putative tubulin--tyrosine ligase PBY1 [Wallemia ichthyophaga EXF-994]TIB10447.1 hypothetical protein E3P92_03203 [Wallemia ichthyophaga]TIB31169.1 hypothetical protein E3P84_03062 [Wallemia ichthyophaga]TIB40311.1 hypothetical protein E3P83_03005 [Wallemia ichthyophaga]
MRILLVNDDGPPAPASPFIRDFYIALSRHHDVYVVLPAQQRSWIGLSFLIDQPAVGYYYYLKRDPSATAETSDIGRPLKNDEICRWILITGTPASVANIALTNIYTDIDVVISGPNYGRNSSTPLVMSSGTVGGALGSAIRGFKAISLSYGIMEQPTDPASIPMAHEWAVHLVNHLISHWNPEADVYSINIPLVKSLPNAVAKYTCIQKSTFDRLFLPSLPSNPSKPTTTTPHIQDGAPLSFAWAPDIRKLIECSPDSLDTDTDAHCLSQGNISIVPLRANYETCYTNNTHNSTLPPRGSTIAK